MLAGVPYYNYSIVIYPQNPILIIEAPILTLSPGNGRISIQAHVHSQPFSAKTFRNERENSSSCNFHEVGQSRSGLKTVTNHPIASFKLFGVCGIAFSYHRDDDDDDDMSDWWCHS